MLRFCTTSPELLHSLTRFHGLWNLFTWLRLVNSLSLYLHLSFLNVILSDIYSGFTVGHYVDYDAKGEEGSSSFQEDAVSTV